LLLSYASHSTSDKVFKVTLGYNNAPGALLQNCLNLTVVASDGVAKDGNGLKKYLDEANDIEQIM
jgi:hypothetical protein